MSKLKGVFSDFVNLGLYQDLRGLLKELKRDDGDELVCRNVGLHLQDAW